MWTDALLTFERRGVGFAHEDNATLGNVRLSIAGNGSFQLVFRAFEPVYDLICAGEHTRVRKR